MEYLRIRQYLLAATEELSDSERGRLFRGMLQYALDDEEPELSGNERILWPLVKSDIDEQKKESKNVFDSLWGYETDIPEL